MNKVEVTKEKEQRENKRCYFLLIIFIFILFVFFFVEILKIYRIQEVDGSVFEVMYHRRYWNLPIKLQEAPVTAPALCVLCELDVGVHLSSEYDWIPPSSS